MTDAEMRRGLDAGEGGKFGLRPVLALCHFSRTHKTLRVTPAMAAGITDKLWTLVDIVVLVDERAPKRGPRKAYNKRKD
jgi:hypothetical protein